MTSYSRKDNPDDWAKNPVRLLQALCVSTFLVAPVVAAPVVTGNEISWPDDGWYQVQSTEDNTSICEGGRSCTVEPGSYRVINHSTGERFDSVIVVDAPVVVVPPVVVEPPVNSSGVTVEGGMISWPDDGWYQVQNASTYQTVCEGGRSCQPGPGTYKVINHSTGTKFEGIVVTDEVVDPDPAVDPVVDPDPEPSAVTVEGGLISWPDDGWYQVQNASTYETVCESGRSCQPGPGIYKVINHSTGVSYEGIVVTGEVVDPDPVVDPNPTTVTVDGLTISWPDDGWYQVQIASTYETVCEGGRSCEVGPGTYNVINHSTDTNYDSIVVAGEGVDPDPDPGYDPNYVEPIPTPNADDPFGALLEIDTEAAVPGGAPTQPKNLRLDLVSNNWAEISWAPSNDDGTVVQYDISRSDGVVYEIRQDQTNANAQAEINKYWLTTSFIDCNFTRFSQLVHPCADTQPTPGQTYSYEVTAIDNDGMRSVASEPLEVTYLEEQGAPITPYRDFYRAVADTFVDDADLAEVPNWLNEFDLIFSDEFNGDSIDASKWNTDLTWGDSEIINGEQQFFVNTQDDPDFGYDPFSFTGESLVINAIPVPDELRANLPAACDEADPTGLDRCEFLSGALSTYDKFQFLYGYTEGRFKVSGAPGALSSFYLYHRYAGTHAPEIDIVEYLGENPFGDEDAFQTYHFRDASTGMTRSAPTMSHAKPDGGNYADGEYHTFGVLWEPQLVIWYIDGVEVKRLFGPQVSRRPMNIINYLVAGSAWAPTPDASNASLFPMQFEADYIRVYQREEYKGTAMFGQ